MLDMMSYLLGKQTSGGGGGGNRQEVVEGTMAQPFGKYSVSEVALALRMGQATAYVAAEVAGRSAVIPLFSESGSMIHGSGAVIEDGDETAQEPQITLAADIRWYNGGLARAWMLTEGQMVDLAPGADTIETTCVLLWHPMEVDLGD